MKLPANNVSQKPKISYSDRSAAERLAKNLRAASTEILAAIKNDNAQRLEDLMVAWNY